MLSGVPPVLMPGRYRWALLPAVNGPA